MVKICFSLFVIIIKVIECKLIFVLFCFVFFVFCVVCRKTTWICPVCDKKASFDKLVLDG